MRQIKSTTALLLIAALSFVSVGYGPCSSGEKDRNIAFARDIAAGMRAAAPIIARKAPKFAERWTAGIGKADKLIDAAAASDSTTMAGLVRDILPTFTEVVNGLPGDDELQWALALGQIALNFYVNHFLKSTSNARAPAKRGGVAMQSDDAEVIDRFKALPQFGCRLLPAKCR